MIYLRNFKKDLSSHTPYKKIDIVAVRHKDRFIKPTLDGFFYLFKINMLIKVENTFNI